jgi:predicted transcriptional regulator
VRRSKLEMYVDILSVLSQRGPLKLTHIMYKANVNCSVLSEHLDFLMKHELIQQIAATKNRTLFAVTQRGIAVLRAFRELKQALPIEAEEERTHPPLFF